MRDTSPWAIGPRRAPGGIPALALALAFAVALPCPAVAAMPPTRDVRDEFSNDPRLRPSWWLKGAWSWGAAAGTLLSGAARSGTALRTDGVSYAGSIRVRLKLIAGAPARARVVFAHDPETGAHRFVQVTAGSPGSVILAQAGTIRGSEPRTIRAFQTPVPRGTWLELEVSVGNGGRVTVARDGQALFTETVLPAAPGEVGIASRASRVAFDRFVFVAAPDAEPCEECHAGNGPAKAANVYAYWDGDWWDGTQGGSPGTQQGGHGDSGGKPATRCSGPAGCHSLRLPDPRDHRNGVHEPSENLTVNPWHLRSGFIERRPSDPWDVQLTFDGFCTTACHEGDGVRRMRHRGVTQGRDYLQLGYGFTDPAGRGLPEGFPLAADLTSRAGSGGPLFATCVTCHDPHGTGTTDTSYGSNRMVRVGWEAGSELCAACHR